MIPINAKEKIAEIVGLMLLVLSFSGCTAFFDVDLKETEVNLLSPPDNYSSEQQVVNFWWDEVDGIENYRIQIVQPDFEFPIELLLDSTLKSNKFSRTLLPGDYQWRVRAENSSSETDYQTFSFEVSIDSSLFGEDLQIDAPQNNFETKRDSIVFKWFPLLYADYYQLEVASSPSFNPADLILDEQVATTFYSSINQLGNGTFYWRVTALNVNSSSDFSETAVFRIDNIAPVPANLLFPANGAQLDKNLDVPFDFLWSSAADAVSDSLIVSTDTTMMPLYLYDVSGISSLSFSDTLVQNYFWKVKSKDALDNASESEWKNFEIL